MWIELYIIIYKLGLLWTVERLKLFLDLDE